MRRNLVIVRAGDESRHPAWLESASARNWDLIVSYYDNSADKFRQADVLRFDAKGPKYPPLGRLLADQAVLVARYDYIWLPDDDLECGAAEIDRLFDTCRDYDLWLAQPALTADSQFTWPATLRNPCCRLRFTNFVEIMMPCFQRAFLERCRPSFLRSESGWGLDFLWPQLARSTPRRIAIIDDVAVAHRRPLSGPHYAFLPGRSAAQEGEELLQAEGIVDRQIRIEALVGRGSRRFDGRSLAGRLLLATGWALTTMRAFALGYPNRRCFVGRLKQLLRQIRFVRFIWRHARKLLRRPLPADPPKIVVNGEKQKKL